MRDRETLRDTRETITKKNIPTSESLRVPSPSLFAILPSGHERNELLRVTFRRPRFSYHHHQQQQQQQQGNKNKSQSYECEERILPGSFQGLLGVRAVVREFGAVQREEVRERHGEIREEENEE